MAPDSKEKRQILVADDDPAILRLVSAILEKENYGVTTARDGREAYKILQGSANFIAAIFDVVMPHISGPELVRYMKTEKRLMNVPVMMMTAEQDPKLSSDSFAAGAVVFMPTLACCVMVLAGVDARADLSASQARKVISRIAGFELKSSEVRVKSISASSSSAAEVSAEIKTVLKFEADKDGRWRVAEIRTGQDRWESVDLIANALGTQASKGDCNALDSSVRGKEALDPSVKRARCLLGHLLGVEIPSDLIRIQEVNPMPLPMASQPSATVVAWLRFDTRLTSD